MSTTSPETTLDQLFADEWAFRLREEPLMATMIYGEHATDDRLPSATLESMTRRADTLRAFQARLLALDPHTLPTTRRLDYAIFAQLLADQLAEYDFQTYLLPATNLGSFCLSFAELPLHLTFATVLDYENFIARLRAFPTWTDENIALMRAGLAAGFRPPLVTVNALPTMVANLIVSDPTTSALYTPFTKFPPTIAPDERTRLAAAAQAALTSATIPAFYTFHTFLTAEYLPAARADYAVSALPNGAALYAHRVRMETTLPITPEEVHAIGQAEVRRIFAEMEAVIAGVGFTGGFQAFVADLRTNPRFYATSEHALLAEVSFILKRMDGELPRLFRNFPRTPYGVLPVPSFMAPNQTTAYYTQPSADGSRAGIYFVNTYDLPSRPLYELEALSLHEAVPGHHLQIALQQELPNVPNFRRFDFFNAYLEGWALYSERLGLEVGFYQDPYSNFGRLTYEMWRACRLVVDTGLHALGWTRQQAIDFMTEHTALTVLNITNEVDRYIAWPGQALSYKMGEIKIRALRAEAEAALGARFDLRSFHDRVLARGCVPLTLLEEDVRAWVAEQEA